MSLRIGPGRKEGHAWRRRLACERGIALPTAVMMLMAVMMLASAASIAAISAMGQSTHDRGTKRAVAAADAGLDTAVYRLNKLEPSPLTCVAVNLNDPTLILQQIQVNGWCAPTPEEDLGDGATFSYQMSAGVTLNLSGQGPLLQRRIVATGTANGVTRRAMTTVGSLTGVSVFGGNAVTSLEDLTLPSGTNIIGNAASDGSMNLQNCSQLAGDAQVGPGGEFLVGGTPQQDCPGFTTVRPTQNLVLNPVDGGNAWDTNSNTRIGAVGGDPFVNILSTWNSTTHVLKLKSGSTLTLSGDTYSFCYLEISNLAQLIIAPRLSTQAPVKIYIESPDSAHCATLPDAEKGKVKLLNQGSVTNLNATADTLQLYAVGSTSNPASASLVFQNNSNFKGLVYAPRSTVSLENSTSILGSVAAHTVTLGGSASVQWDPTADVTLDNLSPLFKRTSWVECTSTPTGSAPDAGC